MAGKVLYLAPWESSVMPDSEAHKGQCLCGKVVLEIGRFNRDVIICHCQQCRKQTGHMVAAANVKDEHLHIIGAEHLTWFAASSVAKRGFCKHCGSLLFWKPDNSDYTSVMAGCIDTPTGLTAISHIYTADKGDYYTIEDGLPQFLQSD